MKKNYKRNTQPYYVSYSHKSAFGKENGFKSFSTFKQAQLFAVKVDKKKTYTLNHWGTKSCSKY